MFNQTQSLMHFTNANITNITNITNIASIINNGNPIIKLLISSFIAHGFLDYITLFPNFANHLSWYITCILLSFLSMMYYPALGLMIFIGTSMYHFGEDFRYLTETFNIPFKLSKYKATSTRWGGAMLFASSVFRDWNIWQSTIKWLRVSNPMLSTAAVLAMGIPALTNIFTDPISIIVPAVIGGFGGVNPGLIIYSCCIHTPLAIYRYLTDDNISKKVKYFCTITWLGGTVVVFFGMNYIGHLTPTLFNAGIGIVVSHVIFITRWQRQIISKNSHKHITQIHRY